MANPLIFSEEGSLPEVSCENISTGSYSEWFMVKFPFQIDIKAAALGNDKDIETCDNAFTVRIVSYITDSISQLIEPHDSQSQLSIRVCML